MNTIQHSAPTGLGYIACVKNLSENRKLNNPALRFSNRLSSDLLRIAKLTLGLRTAFLRLRIAQTLFSVSSKQKSDSQNIKNAFQ